MSSSSFPDRLETHGRIKVLGNKLIIWKNAFSVVLIGEYKRMPRDIDGAVALQKRNGDDFYLRYHAQGKLANFSRNRNIESIQAKHYFRFLFLHIIINQS